MTLRDMQRAADDLGDVENALWNIRELLPSHPRSRIPAKYTVRTDQPIVRWQYHVVKKPHLPRCSAWTRGKDAPCAEAATYPEGLCPAHFLAKFGHSFRQEDPGLWWGHYMICDCGSRHLCDDHKKHPALRERCPLKEKST